MYQAFIWIYYSASRFSAKSVGKHCFKSAKYHQNEIYHKCLTFHIDFEQVFAAYVSTHLLFCTCSLISTLVTPNILECYFSSAPGPRPHLLLYGPLPQLLFRRAHVSKLLFHGPEWSKLLFHGPSSRKHFLYFCIVKVSNFSIEGR